MRECCPGDHGGHRRIRICPAGIPAGSGFPYGLAIDAKCGERRGTIPLPACSSTAPEKFYVGKRRMDDG